MKIQIIGAGVVGQATGKGFARLGHDVTFIDLNPHTLDGLQPEFKTVMDATSEADIYFICTPEGVVEEAVIGLTTIPIKPYPPIIIRSTVPPGTASRVWRKLKRNILSNPEFLREAVAEYDFLNPPGIIIGVDWDNPQANIDEIRVLYEPFRRPIHYTNTATAELTKLAVNSYLACQISYWNQVKLLADKLGVNSQEVGMLACFGDGRVSPYGSRMHGKPYGGKCLPKDLLQLMDIGNQNGVDQPLLLAIYHINQLMKGVE